MRKLISMVEFVLDQHETETLDTSQIMWYDKEVEKLCKIRKYANFIKQPLAIWQFVPCDENNILLYEPEHYDLWRKYGSFSQYGEHLTSVCEPYFKAKSRCIFEGFEYKKELRNTGGNYTHLLSRQDIEIYIQWGGFHLYGKYSLKTIEDLVKYNLELTASAIKELGL